MSNNQFKNIYRILASIPFLLLTSCWSDFGNDETEFDAPVAKRITHTIKLHGDSRSDDYFWIRDDTRANTEVLSLLAAENRFTEAVMAHTKDLQTTLFNEITQRLTTNDSTVPITQNGFDYHREFRIGGEYPIYLRRRLDEANAKILLDVNVLAKNHDFFKVGNWVVSPDNDVLAYASDAISRRVYKIQFKHISTAEVLPDVIENVSSSFVWANDNKTLFYVEKDPQTLLPFRVKRHVLGRPVATDIIVYEERDHAFSVSLNKTRSEKYITINLDSTDANEILLINADSATSKPQSFLPRRPNHQYRIRHKDNQFYILSNWQAPSFKLLVVADSMIGDMQQWQIVIDHDASILLEDIEVFTNFLVIAERADAITRLRVINLMDHSVKFVDFPDPTYTVRIHANPEINTNLLRYAYSSLIRPESIYAYNMDKGVSILLKEDKVFGNFNRRLYKSERINIIARDGEQVPVSLVYRPDLYIAGENPLYLYAYGAYGYSMNPAFNSKRLSLLDRGFVFAIVHVRGGQDKGREWYEQGRLLQKRHTFWDFIDATTALVEKGYGHENKVFAQGGSAGGLLMGVIANEAPEKYLGIIAHVPFVDVVTTMMDLSIPLTAGGRSEWGNPEILEEYEYMLSYSPYDQVKKQAYPNMFVTAGLYDSQVQFYEPVKWVSKLRRMNRGDNKILLDINMETGHNGASDRYQRYQTDALEYAFILDILAQSDNEKR